MASLEPRFRRLGGLRFLLHLRAWVVDLKWSDLRAWGQSPLVRLSFVWVGVVPVVARVVHHLRENVTQPPWLVSIVDSLRVPFTWEVLFWAAVAFTVGRLTFARACPRLIQDHADFGSFKNAGKSLPHVIDYARSIAGERYEIIGLEDVDERERVWGQTIGRGPNPVLVTREWLEAVNVVDSVREEIDEFGAGDPNVSRRLNDEMAFWAVRGAAQRLRLFWLYFAASLFRGGMLALAWVFIENAIWVIRAAL